MIIDRLCEGLVVCRALTDHFIDVWTNGAGPSHTFYFPALLVVVECLRVSHVLFETCFALLVDTRTDGGVCCGRGRRAAIFSVGHGNDQEERQSDAQYSKNLTGRFHTSGGESDRNILGGYDSRVKATVLSVR